MSSADPLDLGRFVAAQFGIHDGAQEELRSGQKRSHWMWFVFPQIDGLGRSHTAQRDALKSRDEARGYAFVALTEKTPIALKLARVDVGAAAKPEAKIVENPR